MRTSQIGALHRSAAYLFHIEHNKIGAAIWTNIINISYVIAFGTLVASGPVLQSKQDAGRVYIVAIVPRTPVCERHSRIITIVAHSISLLLIDKLMINSRRGGSGACIGEIKITLSLLTPDMQMLCCNDNIIFSPAASESVIPRRRF